MPPLQPLGVSDLSVEICFELLQIPDSIGVVLHEKTGIPAGFWHCGRV